MDDNRTANQLLFGELPQGKRPRRRPKLRFKDICKSNLTNCHIDAKTWERLAEDRTAWKISENKGVKRLEEENTLAFEAKFQRKKGTHHRPAVPSLLADLAAERAHQTEEGSAMREAGGERKREPR